MGLDLFCKPLVGTVSRIMNRDLARWFKGTVEDFKGTCVFKVAVLMAVGLLA